MKANTKYVLARVSPKELLVSTGPFGRQYMELTFETSETCQFVYELYETLTRSPMPGEEIVASFQAGGHDLAILERLEEMQVIIPAVVEDPRIQAYVVKNGEGKLAQALQRHLNALGFTAEVVALAEDIQEGHMLVAALDHWEPRTLRNLENRALSNRNDFLPIVYVAEGGFIGPCASPQTARYVDFETQFDASLFSWLGWRSYREVMASTGRDKAHAPPLPHVEFITSLAAMLIQKHWAQDKNLLANKVILVDLVSLYIEDVRIYRVHTGHVNPRVEI
nr:hypothetical protein [Ardenticatena sp.]